MTKAKSTQKALIASAVSLIVCITMLIGTTFAWFTDSVESGRNQIVAGNLDVELEYSLDGENWAPVDENTNVFLNDSLWEPGHVEAVALRVTNKGTLALKYALSSIVYKEVGSINVYDEPFKLSEHLVVRGITMDTGAIGDALAKYYLSSRPATQALSSEYNFGENFAEDEYLPAGYSKYFILAIEMPETVGNEANYKTGENAPSIEFGVNLFATQVPSEEDSFGSDYDATAQYDMVIVYTTEELEKAIADGYETIGIVGDKVELNYEVNSGVYKTGAKLVGLTDDATITFTGLGTGSVDVSLENLTVVDETCYRSENGENAWEFTYLELTGTNTYKNVVFTDGVMFDGDADITCVDCTFMGHNNDSSSYGNVTMYGAWVCNGKATFKNCTFTGTRGLKACDQYAGVLESVVVDGCTFDKLSEKPGVAIDDRNDNDGDNQDAEIIIKNSKFIYCQPGDQGNYMYETDNTVPALENNTVISEGYTITEINTVEDMILFADSVNLGNANYSGLTVKLNADIDLAGIDWEPIGQTGATEFKGVFDGQGHTISNLTIDSSAQTGDYYSSALFGWIESHGNQNITVKNVNINNASVSGHHNVAVIAGYVEGGAVIENCHVTGATLVNTHANDEACGDKTGVIAGYVAGEATIKNCSATDSTVAGSRDAGQLLGASYAVPVDCSANNVTVSAIGDCTGANISNALIGRVLG